MSVKSGYGSINGVVNSTTNCSLAINLPPNGAKRILDIFAGYSLRRGGTNTVLTQGRLLVVGMKFESATAFIEPVQSDAGAAIGNAKIYFDAPIAVDGNNKAILKSFSWQNGLIVPDGVDASIILTACFGDGSAPPAAADVNAFLNVNGLVAGSDKIFKNV